MQSDKSCILFEFETKYFNWLSRISIRSNGIFDDRFFYLEISKEIECYGNELWCVHWELFELW